MEINNPAYTDFFFKVFWRQLLGLGCFKRLQLLQTAVCNLILERLLPTQEILLQLTSYLDFSWLRTHFELRPALRILEEKPAISKSHILQYSSTPSTRYRYEGTSTPNACKSAYSSISQQRQQQNGRNVHCRQYRQREFQIHGCTWYDTRDELY